MPATAELGLPMQHFTAPKREPAPVGIPLTREFLPEVDGYPHAEARWIRQRPTLREHLNLVTERKREWAQVLGPQEKFLSYDPILTRVHFELAQTQTERERLRRIELKNIETALRERHHAEKSELTLVIDANGKLRAEKHAHEPWEDVIERGRIHRAELGSNETIRENAELYGFRKTQAHLADPLTPIGEMDMVISPPGKKGGPYPDNYIDIRRKAYNAETGEAYIQYTRYTSPLSDAQTEKIIRGIDARYYDGENLPRDAWYLHKPIQIPGGRYASIQECFDALFARDVQAMQEEQFQREIWSISVPAALHLIDVLSREEFDPLEIAKAENTLLLMPDKKELQERVKEITVFLSPQATRLDSANQQLMGALSNTFGYEKPKDVLAGCGSSGGTKIESNSVAKFGLPEDNYGKRTFECPSCGQTNLREYDELRTECEHCKSTEVACDPNGEVKKPEMKKEKKAENKADAPKKEKLALAA